MKKFKKLTLPVGGFFIGIINGMLGAGGGVLAVPLLARMGLDTKKSHAGAVGVILPITVLSAFLYIKGGHIELSRALPFIPGGLIGAALGALLLKKIGDGFLRGIFGGMIILAGIRMMFR